MGQKKGNEERRYKGVSALPQARGGRRFVAKIRKGKGVDAHLGIYEFAGHAAFAFNVAAVALGRGSRPPNDIPREEQPDADTVRWIGERVRDRLDLEPQGRRRGEVFPPDPEGLLTLFEVAVVGFWRGEAAQGDSGSGVDAAARRLAESARLIFWNPAAGHPDPSEAMARLLARRIDQAFRRSDLAREILDDDEDEDWRVARWLVMPDVFPAGRGFRDEVRHLYPDAFGGVEEVGSTSGVPHWSVILGVVPPFAADAIRDAYRLRSKAAHPDAGGSHAEFVRLRAAFEEAREYCRVREYLSRAGTVQLPIGANWIQTGTGTATGSPTCWSVPDWG